MKVFASYIEAGKEIRTPHVVTIGNFDGVHVGHRALLAAAEREANRLNLPQAVLTFDPHPSAVLNPEMAPQNLVSAERKQELLAECGIHTAVFQRFDEEFAALSAEFFAREILARALRAEVVIVGANFRFGRNREADIDSLKSMGDDFGFQVYVSPLVSVDFATVSSSRIRALLSQGDVRSAAVLLGRRHEVRGTVARDRQVGRQMGFPTLNLADVQVMIPRDGIYAALADVNGHRVKAAVYIGLRPTQAAGFSIEAHLLDFEGDVYDHQVTLHFVERVRNDMKFENTRDLIAQIESDVRTIRRILEDDA